MAQRPLLALIRRSGAPQPDQPFDFIKWRLERTEKTIAGLPGPGERPVLRGFSTAEGNR